MLLGKSAGHDATELDRRRNRVGTATPDLARTSLPVHNMPSSRSGP